MKRLLVLICILGAVHGRAQQNGQLSVLQMGKDIKLLESALYNLHPGLYKFNTKPEFETHVTALKNACSTPLSLKQFYLEVSKFVNKIKCGHTFPNPLNLSDSIKSLLIGNMVLPFFFQIVDGKIIITHNISDQSAIKAGDEIVSINKRSSGEIIEKLLTVSRADGNNAVHKKLSNIGITAGDSYGASLFDSYFPLLFPSSNENFEIAIKPASKAKLIYSLPYITQQQRIARYEKAFGKVQEDEATWVSTMLNQHTGYLKFGTFAFWNSDFKWKNYIDSCFKVLNDNANIKNLVIDLRGNEGGSGEIRDYILSMITTKPLMNERASVNCYRYLTIPDSLKPLLSSWDRSFKMPKNPTEFFVNDIGLYQKKQQAPVVPIMPNQLAFKGKIYLLVDATCSSATFGLAWTFQYNKLGTIIGETTGGTKRGLNGSEMFFFTMPNSKIEIDIPIIYFYTKDVKDEGVVPDILIKPTQQTIYKNIDPVLNYFK